MSQLLPCLNPLKRVNSILTRRIVLREESEETLLSQSPQTGQFNSYGWKIAKRTTDGTEVSIPSNGSIQFLQRRFQVIVEQGVGRSKKTVMVKRWLRGWGAYFLTLFN